MKVSKEALDLINSGNSINKISRITGLSKSTIYFHYKKIRGKKIKGIKLSFKNNNQIGEFIGIFAGDGFFIKYKDGHYTIRISIGYYEKNYGLFLKKEFLKWFNKEPHIYYQMKNNIRNVMILEYHSKDIYNLITKYLYWINRKTYTVKLKELNIKNKKFNLGFLRGLIDTDGNYYKPKNRLSFSTVSESLAKQVFNIIKYHFNINSKFYITYKINRAPLYSIILYGKSAEKVIKTIHPHNKNKGTVVV